MRMENHINCNLKDIPFKTSLSFELLINEIEQISQNSKHPMQVMAGSLISELNKFPELKKPVCPDTVLEKHPEQGLQFYKCLAGLIGNRLLWSYKMITSTAKAEDAPSFGTGQIQESEAAA